MAEALDHLDQVLDYVYTETGGKSTETVAILEFCESLSLDMDDAFTISRALYDADMTERSDTMGSPRIRLTGRGLAYVIQMRQRRDDPALRAAGCRTEMLRWLYRQQIAGNFMPKVSDFGQSDGVVHEGSRFTEIEIQGAAVYLATKGLIKGNIAAGLRAPAHAEITPEGVDCVTDWSGDVAQYLRDQRGYGPTTHNHGPVFHGSADGNQIAWNNRDVTQITGGQQITPGYQPVADVVEAVLRALPNLGLTAEDASDVQAAAEEVADEIVEDQPRQHLIARAFRGVVRILMPIVNGAVAGVADQAREDAGKLVEHIQAAIGS